MTGFSAIANGFRLIFRRPLIWSAEIACRWALGIAACLLSGSFLIEYASTLPVDIVDRVLIGSQQQALVMAALRRIFHGSALRFSATAILLLASMTVAWAIAGAFVRAAVLQSISEELGLKLRTRAKQLVPSLISLNFLRALVAFAAIFAACGTILIASGVWASTRLPSSSAAALWIILLYLVLTAWLLLNWLFSTAAIFADERPGFEAIGATLLWLRDRSGSVILAGFCFGFLHLMAFAVACSAALSVAGMTGIIGPGGTWFAELAIAALYFAVADFLFVGRLTAYLSIAREDEFPRPAVFDEAPAGGPGSFAVDQSELILSDVPLPAS